MFYGFSNSLLILSVALVTGALDSTKCSDDMDCSLLGTCTDGRCICDLGWKGSQCFIPDLLPASKYGGYRNKTFASWGGRTVEINGTYHLLGSSITRHCLLSQFSTNSQSIHAVSQKPEGPYTFQNIALPPFHHSTTVISHPDGGFLLFTIGIDTHHLNEHNCTPPQGIEDLRAGSPSISHIGPHDYLSVSYSKSIEGPWDEHIIFKTDPSEPTKWNCNKSNPSPIVFPNGTILLAYRGTPCIRDKSCRNKTINLCEHTGFAVADHWKGPYIPRSDGMVAALSGNEDQMFWRSKRGYHMIFHSKNACTTYGQEKSCGSYAFSQDSYNWTLRKQPAYDAAVEWDDGTKENLLSRQRPKMLFANDGTPLVLFNGVLSNDSPLEWTMAQRFNMQT